MPARADHAIEFGAERGQVADFAVDFGQVDPRNAVHGLAGLRLVVGKREQLALGFEREAEISGAAVEREASEMIASIGR